MSLERVFAKIIFYFIEIAAKGFVSYLTYCGLLEFTNKGLGAFYIAIAVFMTLIILGWNMEKISEEVIEEYEEAEEESE